MSECACYFARWAVSVRHHVRLLFIKGGAKSIIDKSGTNFSDKPALFRVFEFGLATLDPLIVATALSDAMARVDKRLVVD